MSMADPPCPHDLEITERGPVVWVTQPKVWHGNADEDTVVTAGERAYVLVCKRCGFKAIRVIRIGMDAISIGDEAPSDPD